MSLFNLAISCLIMSNLLSLIMSLIHGPNIPGSYAMLFFSIKLNFHHLTHLQLSIIFALAQLLGAISNCPQLFPSSILDTFWPGMSSFSVVFFVFSYSSWGLPVVCHFLLQWTTFRHNSSLWSCPSWVAQHGMAYINSLTELLKHLSTTLLWSMKGAYETTQTIKTNHTIFQCLSPSGMAHSLPVECGLL